MPETPNPRLDRNAEALRETRRQLDPEMARVADNARGVEALESPVDPDRASGCVGPAGREEEPREGAR